MNAAAGELRQREQDVGEREHPDHAAERDNAVGTNHVLTITVNAINGGMLDAGTRDGEHRRIAEHDRLLRRLAHVHLHGRRRPRRAARSRSRRRSPARRWSQATSTSRFARGRDDHPHDRDGRRTRCGCTANCGNASKSTGSNANIQITPPNADQPGRHEPRAHDHGQRAQRHDRRRPAHGDRVDRQPARAASSARPTCTYTGGGATASCTVTITSAVTGTTHRLRDVEHPGQTGRRSPARPGRRRTRRPAAAANASKNWARLDDRHARPQRGGRRRHQHHGRAGHGRPRRGDGDEGGRARRPASPNPTGTVTFTLYTAAPATARCSRPTRTSRSSAAVPRRRSPSRRRPRAGRSRTSRTTTGTRTTRATTPLCEPFAVTAVDANIQITPADRDQRGRHEPHADRPRERQRGRRLRATPRPGR